MRWPFARGASVRPAFDPIDAAVWADVVAAPLFRDRLDDDARGRLRERAGEFLASKAINGAGGFELDARVAASIAAQAALPVLELGIDAYPRFDEVIVYPGEFVVERRVADDDGVVHEWREAIAGEAWDGGPVVLAWDAVAGTNRRALARPMPYVANVVIHEFAHKLDMSNGSVDGMPRFLPRLHRGLSPVVWREVLEASFDAFVGRVEDVERSIPRHVDPDSIRADRHYATLPFDAYAATDEGEFFSVTSEAFFATPQRLADACPDWHRLLEAYYRPSSVA